MKKKKKSLSMTNEITTKTYWNVIKTNQIFTNLQTLWHSSNICDQILWIHLGIMKYHKFHWLNYIIYSTIIHYCFISISVNWRQNSHALFSLNKLSCQCFHKEHVSVRGLPYLNPGQVRLCRIGSINSKINSFTITSSCKRKEESSMLTIHMKGATSFLL